MEFFLQVFNLTVFSVLFSWALIEFLKQKSRPKEEGEVINQEIKTSKSIPFTEITLLLNILISILYLGFSIYKFWNQKVISFDSGFPSITWTVITVFSVYCKKKTVAYTNKWPLGLIFWWLFSSIFDTFSISICLFAHWKSIRLPDFIPAANFPDFASLPFSIFLCFNFLAMNAGQNATEIRRPLLSREESDDNVAGDSFSEAGIWSRISFRWLNSLFDKGRSRRLEFRHVPPVPESETAEQAFALLQEAIRREKTEASSLMKAIGHAVWRPLAINAVFAGINTLFSYMGPFLITNFVDFLSQKPDASNHIHSGHFLAFLFFFAKTIESLTQRQWYFGAHRIGIRVRAALMVSIYKKSLSIKNSGMSNGKIINFINVDVERIGDIWWYVHGIWLLPLQVSLALIILYRNLGGAPSAAAFLTTVLVMVTNTPLANLQEKLHSKIMEAKDSRIKATSETLKSMRILKFQSWEATYLNKLLELRETERSWLKRYLYTCSSIAFLFWASPTLVSMATFGMCILVKTPLTSGVVLSALATFRILQEPIYNLPELISMVAQTKVSIDRIEDFIKEEEMKSIQNCCSKASDVVVEIEPGEFGWEANSSKSTVKVDQKIKIIRGEKVAICGSVGSGKSSLICSIIGEIPKIYGAGIKVFGSKAYVPQSAWIQTGSIRENVLFGKEMEKELYRDVMEGCALDRDIEMLVDRDLSVVGERGMNLSGGQKQRVQLARAIYSDSDVYLLDDPFSAVDAHTGAHLFKECLTRLLSRKTVIYVTHQLEFLDASDLVLVMLDGKIVQSGKYEDLIADTNGELVRQMAAHTQSLRQVTPPQQRTLTNAPQRIQHQELEEEKLEDHNTESKNRIHDEERETGRVKWKVYSTFLTSAYKGALIPVILLCQILFQGLQMGSNYWIAWGTEKSGKVSKEKLIGVFVLMSVGSSIFVLGRAVLLTTIAIETAQRLFLGMMTCVFRAPISFFDSTPSSRILSRSSTDQSTVDTDIPYRLAGLAFALVQLLGIIILMSQVAWQVFLLFLAVIALSIWYQAYYITTARELARMVGVKKSPILHHFSESIAGASTIRCFNQEDRFLAKSLTLIDDYSSIAFYNSATMEWLCIRINFLFNLVFFLVLIILVSLPRDSIDPSLAGLAATYGLNLNVLQAWVIWNLCNVENKMISVERILQFSNIPSEAPLVIESCRPGPEWPKNGTVMLDDLHVQYSPSLPMVLRGVTCTFPGEKKIGVVGRTGSGKSTLIQALFRVVEPSQGNIIIDGVDICQMGLHDLRSRLSIIPQDPTLFQGTVRTNLDPLQEHSDAEIWEALNKCHLGEIVRKDQRLLDAPVAEEGENWSVGQRQLVCLDRVLLKKRRILVLDEATASVDTATDNAIQKTLREETGSCTVITVAHRIPTVIDNDLVLVLDEGKVVEYDSPAQLLDDSSSAFSKLVMEFLRRSKTNHHPPFT